MKKIVTEVQKHKHTDSCRKYTGKCRYGFPRLPSAKTLLARPIEETHPNLNEKEKAKLKERATKSCWWIIHSSDPIVIENASVLLVLFITEAIIPMLYTHQPT